MSNLTKLSGQTNPKFELHIAINGQYYWRFKASNGEILCHSETYSSKQKAEQGVKSLITNVKERGSSGLEFHKAISGSYFWRFKASNGEILCHSETYSSKQKAEQGALSLIESIKAKY